MMKKMIVAIITILLVMIMPAAVYADEQVEEIIPPEEMEIAQTETEESEIQAEEEAEAVPEIPEYAPEIESNSEAEISPVTEEIQKDEEEAAQEEIAPEEAESEPTEPADCSEEASEREPEEPADCSEEDIYEEVWDEPDFEEDEEDPVYELVRLYVAHRAKQGEVDISSFGLKAGEEDELSGYLSMSLDDFIIIEENGILVAVIIGDSEDVDYEDDEVVAEYIASPDDSYIEPALCAASYEEPVLIEGAEEEQEEAENAVISAASNKTVERGLENEATEEPIGLFMTIVLIIATVLKHAATLL